MFGADEPSVDVREPVHQPVGADVDAVSADSQQGQIEGQHPGEGFVLAHVGLEHVEHVEALPEQEQADEDEAVTEVELAFAGQRPDSAGEEQDGGKS